MVKQAPKQPAPRDFEELAEADILSIADHLARLQAVPEWAIYEEMLQSLRLGYLERMADATTPEDITSFQVAAATIKTILWRPQRIVAGAQAIRDAEAQPRLGKKLLRPARRVSAEDDLSL